MNNRRNLFLLFIAFALGLMGYKAVRHEGTGGMISRNILRPARAVSSLMRALRPNYPYSVVPGGVYSPAELRFALEKDPVVRAHYSGFNVNSAHLVTLVEDRFQYVSYRQNNRIYWTSKRLRIPKGEVLLTDGQNYARTRCGNRLCPTLQGPASPHEPSSALLTLPEAKPQSLTVGPIQLAPSPSLGELAQEADTLPLDVPRTAPVAPAATSPFEAGNGLGPTGFGASPGGFPGTLVANNKPLSANNSAATGTATSTPNGQTPVTPGGGGLPVIAVVPEPRALPLLVSLSCISLGLIARYKRKLRAQDRHV